MNREEHDRHEHREIDHKNFSRLERQQTLRFRNINREQRERRERYEQREINHKIIFAVRMTADTLSIS